MDYIHAQLRKTRQYIDAYAHMDDWDSKIFTFKMLKGKKTRNGIGHEDGGTWRYRFIGSKKLNQKEQAQSIIDTMSGSPCTHAHDCCGCATRHVRVKNIKKGIFSVSITVSYNY